MTPSILLSLGSCGWDGASACRLWRLPRALGKMGALSPWGAGPGCPSFAARSQLCLCLCTCFCERAQRRLPGHASHCPALGVRSRVRSGAGVGAGGCVGSGRDSMPFKAI